MLYVPGSLKNTDCERIRIPLVPGAVNYRVSVVKIGDNHQDALNLEKNTAITSRIEEMLTGF